MDQLPSSKMKYALAFETSGAIGEVAIARGSEVLATQRFEKKRAHATEFLPAIDELCRKQGLTPDQILSVYVSSGPGSFTGLRIGITAARMLAFAQGTSVVKVPTLDVIAQNALSVPTPPDEVAVVLDAKRGRVYANSFRLENGTYVAIGTAAEIEPLTFLRTCSDQCQVLGEGVFYHREMIAKSDRSVMSESLFAPRASVVASLGFSRARLGDFTQPRELVPTYIRPPEAEEKWAQRHSDNTP